MSQISNHHPEIVEAVNRFPDDPEDAGILAEPTPEEQAEYEAWQDSRAQVDLAPFRVLLAAYRKTAQEARCGQGPAVIWQAPIWSAAALWLEMAMQEFQTHYPQAR